MVYSLSFSPGTCVKLRACSFSVIFTLLMMHRAGKESKQREVSGLENATGVTAHLQTA